MSEHIALIWNVKKGTEEEVAKLFEDYHAPDYIARDAEGNEVGRLISTAVFMRDNTVVRMIEFEGPFPLISKHLSQQKGIRDLEDQLDEYLEEPRDMTTPEGVRDFFQRTGMRCLVARRYEG